MRWQTEQIKKALADLGQIATSSPGGSYDGTNISVYPHGSREYISISPFTDHIEVDDPDDLEAQWAEVRTDGDSRGGLQTENENVGACYGRIVARLRKMGVTTICHHDEIF